MTKPSTKAEFNTFVQGLITEASPVNFPANAARDIENFELNRDGTIFRRRGIDFEPVFEYVGVDATRDTLVKNPPTSFKWMQAAGSSDNNFLVIQTGGRIDFYDMEIEPLSSAFIGFLTLSPTFPVDVQYSFASVDGRLIVAAGVDVIFIIEYSGGIFSASTDRLKVRDVWGVEETVFPQYETDVTFRGIGFSAEHYYNLQNQSWGIPRKDHNGVLGDPITIYANTNGFFLPSNSEAVWPGLQFQPVATGQNPFERIYGNLYEEARGAQFKTARGYYIIDALRRGQSRETEFASNNIKYPTLSVESVDLPSDFTPGGAKIVCEFAGRVFYGGFDGEVIDGDKRSPNLSSIVFFTQLVRSRPDIIKCHQEGDPTSRDSNDIVDTDGGFARLSGVEEILAMVNMSSHLIIVASNGVWAISGGSDYGFSATNFKVEKISNFGGISKRSVVEDAGRAFFWGEDGIYIIDRDQFGSFRVTSATETTIQSFYEAIPNTVKQTAIGCYDAIGKKIRWLYNEGTPFTQSYQARELVLDIPLGAFYKNKIYNNSLNSIMISTLFSGTEFKINNDTENVISGVDFVFSGPDQVVIPNDEIQTGVQSTRYGVIELVGGVPLFTFAFYHDETFVDWESATGTGADAFAFFLTGDQTAGDSSIVKQVPYLTMHFFRTEDGVDGSFIPTHQSGCMVRAQWDFATGSNSNKFSPLWQMYRYRRPYLATSPADPFDTGFPIVTSKTKLRGRGKAFSMYVQTEPEKDCKIIGWNLAINGNGTT